MTQDDVRALAKTVEPFVLEARRHIHANPELSFKEEKTAAYVADRLRDMGYEPETGIGGLYTVKAVLKGGRPGPTIGFRADMDALPVTEAVDLPFKSKNPGAMHACGHDCHTAILLGAAKALKQVQDQVPGNVVFLFQPAEELGPGGAKPMVDAGALKGVDAVFALHIGSALDSGKMTFMPGVSSADCSGLKITITGKGGHAAHPETTIDPVVVAGHVIVALQQIVSRQVGPLQSVVVTIATIHGGTKANIIPDQVEMEGTVRLLDPKLRDLMPQRIERLVTGVCSAFGATGTVEYTHGAPSCVNDPAMVELARQAAALAIGEENVMEGKVSLGGEDFSYMLQVAPGAMGSLGTSDPSIPQNERVPLHNARMTVYEPSLLHGVAYYIALAMSGRLA